MSNVWNVRWLPLACVGALTCLTLAACGGPGTGGAGAAADPASAQATAPLTLTGTPSTSATAGTAYTFTPTAAGGDGSTLSFSITNKPSWASFSSTTGALTGTPTSANAGTTSNIAITVTQGTLTASLATFSITVTASSSSAPPPGSPTISGTPSATVAAGNPYTFTPTASDPQGKALTFSVTNLPSWASFSTTTGQISGTPSSVNGGTTSGITITASDGSLTASLTAFAITVTVPAPTLITGAPSVLYTDLASGPNSGGENNQGVYLSIFGKNYGSTGLGSTVKVYLNNVEVNNYRYLGVSKGRPDIEQITVQIGSIGNPTPGTPLPVKVVVNGVSSNTNVTFTVNPGNFYFVDNVAGNDATGVANDIKHPYRHVQQSSTSAAVWGLVRAGDVIVMRGHGSSPAWTDLGFENYFLRYRDKSGSAPTGQPGTGPITVIGYPNEDVFIDTEKATGFSGGISAINGSNYTGLGQWAQIANLRVEGGGDDGAIDFEILGNYWRVVNNELTAATAQTSARAGGITGNGTGIVVYGNHVHNVHGDGQTNHGIYIDNDGSYDIAYNLVEDIPGGNGVQMYTYGYTSGVQYTQNVKLHHNMIHDVNKHGINVADGTKAGIVIYDNIVYNTMDAGINFNTNTLQGCKVYNNTIYNTDLTGNPSYGAIMNQWTFPAGAIDFENNIIVPSPGMPYGADSLAGAGTVTNNLWYGASDSIAVDSHPISGNPLFTQTQSVTPGSVTVPLAVTTPVDLHLLPGSPAIGAGSVAVLATVSSDYDLLRSIASGATSIDVGALQH